MADEQSQPLSPVTENQKSSDLSSVVIKVEESPSAAQVVEENESIRQVEFIKSTKLTSSQRSELGLWNYQRHIRKLVGKQEVSSPRAMTQDGMSENSVM